MTALRCGAFVSLLVAQSVSYPPPFPRAGATKMLDNDRVQVWNVSWPKGTPTPLHRHPYDMTGTYYAPGDRLITAVDGTKRPVTTAAGGIVWQLRGVTHIEEGTSDVPLRAVMIELKQDGPRGQTETASFPAGAKQLLDNARVTVWETMRTQAPSAFPHKHSRDAVVVSIEGATPRAVYLPRGTVHNEEPIAAAASRVVVFELK